MISQHVIAANQAASQHMSQIFMHSRTFWFFILAVILYIADVVCYTRASYPSRTRWYFQYIPGGGFAALLWLGRDRDDGRE